MDRSEEALMREAFAQRWQILQQARQLRREADDLASAWLDGPYAQHWEYLDTAVSDWVSKPAMMHRYADLLGKWGMPDVTTDLEARSVYQARLLADVDGPNIAPADHQSAVETVQARARQLAQVSDLVNIAHPDLDSTPQPMRADTAPTAPPTAESIGTDRHLDL